MITTLGEPGDGMHYNMNFWDPATALKWCMLSAFAPMENGATIWAYQRALPPAVNVTDVCPNQSPTFADHQEWAQTITALEQMYRASDGSQRCYVDTNG